MSSRGLLGPPWARRPRNTGGACLALALLASCADRDARPAPATDNAATDAGAAAAGGGGPLEPDATPSDAAAVAQCNGSACSEELGGCSAAERLSPPTVEARSLLQVRGSTTLAADTNRSSLGACRDATSGPDVWYELDLGAFTAPVEVHAAVDASFDAALELRRGACADTLSLDCDRAGPLTRASSSLAARLEPGAYWLVVDGADAASHGDFQLHVELDPSPERCSAGVSPNDSCAAAAPLTGGERELLLIDELCAPVADNGYPSLYYELDLTGETAEVLLRAAAWTSSEPARESLFVYAADSPEDTCGGEIALSYLSSGEARPSNAEIQALLAPGRYHLRLELDDDPMRRSALQVWLDRAACGAGPRHNDCSDAAVIDPTLGQQVVSGSTACNANRLVLAECSDVDAPEQLFRLDLRAAAGPVRARIAPLVDGLEFYPILYVLSAGLDGGCGAPLHCDDRADDFEGTPEVDLMLEPSLYFVGIDGADVGARGAFRLLVELGPAQPSPCVNSQIDQCMASTGAPGCCDAWGPGCSDAVAACGLARATQECVCSAEPACCSPDASSVDCSAAHAACDYSCPDFAPSEGSCLGP